MNSEQPTEGAPAAPVTGNATVDEALQRLDTLGERPVTEHADEFEDVHTTLRSVLDGADTPDE